MKIIKSLIVILILASALPAVAQTKYRCLLQMTAYNGENAYVVVSLVDAKGNYDKTLYVMGPDKKWYNSLKEWNKAQQKKPEKLNAITGASIKGGDRSVTTFVLDNSKIDKGYKIRFESSVEDQKYYSNDVEIPYTSDKVTEKTAGKGYIKLVKLSKVQ